MARRDHIEQIVQDDIAARNLSPEISVFIQDKVMPVMRYHITAMVIAMEIDRIEDMADGVEPNVINDEQLRIGIHTGIDEMVKKVRVAISDPDSEQSKRFVGYLNSFVPN